MKARFYHRLGPRKKRVPDSLGQQAIPHLDLSMRLHWYSVFSARITHFGGDPNQFGKEMFRTYLTF